MLQNPPAVDTRFPRSLKVSELSDMEMPHRSQAAKTKQGCERSSCRGNAFMSESDWI